MHRLLVLLVILAPAAPPLAADYPIVSHRHLADPAALVHDGRVYVYCSNDDDNPVEGGYSMKSLVCVSSSDLKNWTDHGEVLRVPAQAAWASHAWAPAAIARNGKIFLYFANNASGIGVASATSPVGPFTEARSGALINSSTPGVLPADNIWIFDPAVFIDDDGQAYLYFGGNGESNLRIIRLNEDMISTSGAAIRLTVPSFFEAAWMHKRGGVYYLSYSTTPAAGLRIDYLTGSGPTGEFTYRGVVAGQPPSNNNNNHAAIFEFNGGWYHVYHNRIVAMEAAIPPVYRRNIAIETLTHEADGSIRAVTYTIDGVAQLHALDPYARVEAETLHASSGIETAPCSEGGMQVTAVDPGDWIRVRGVDFGGRGAVTFEARALAAVGDASIELRLDSPAGTLIGTCPVGASGAAGSWSTVTCPVSGATAVHDLYLVFTGTGANLLDANWWRFTEAPEPPGIATQPRPLTLAPGRRISLWVEATGTPPLQYQWFKGDMPLDGAAGQFLEIAAAAAGDAGRYHVEVSNAAGSVASTAVSVAVQDAVAARLVNMSVRAPLAADAIIIPGFYLSGAAPQQLLVRTVGPTLAGFGVADAHEDPAMTLHAGPSPLATNDNWSDAAQVDAIASIGHALGAFTIPAGSRDAALLVDLAAGGYTTHISGVDGAAGIVLFELYQGTESQGGRLINISARGRIGTGETIMIPGFTLAGDGAMTLLLRAVGPSLEPFGVGDRLADPRLTIFAGPKPILTVDNWQDAADLAGLVAAQSAVHAFGLQDGSTDSAVLVSLMPGIYTVQASGADAAGGNVLVEVYEVP